MKKDNLVWSEKRHRFYETGDLWHEKRKGCFKKFKRGPMSDEHKRKMADAHRGIKSHFWKGGITPINRMLRKDINVRLWRQKVFERDDFTCQECGVRGTQLNADHIKPWSKYPELRYNVENGRTLCVPCHRLTPTFGYKAIHFSTY